MIDQRARNILQKLISHYIREGQPVGSKVLAQDAAIDLSSASIRSIMADLEKAGYLISPHTSAGRVPTTQGYRLFIDHLMTVQPMAAAEVDALRQQLHQDKSARALVNKASQLLSGVTQLAGIVSLPKRQRLLLKQVEFLSLSEKRVLVILVFEGNKIQNRVIKTQQVFSAQALTQAGNYLTEHFSGHDLQSMRQALLSHMQHTKHALQQMADAVVHIMEAAVQPDESDDYVIAGESHLFSAMDQSQYSELKALFEAFTEKRDILYLLDQCLLSRGIKIFVGEEFASQKLSSCSVVTAPYGVGGDVVGVLGVIGPQRMSYEKVVSAVDITAKLLSQALADS